MKFRMNVVIALKSSLDPRHAVEILSPENQTLPEIEITSLAKDDCVETTISGYMKIGTLINTLDDIISTISLASEVSKRTGQD